MKQAIKLAATLAASLSFVLTPAAMAQDMATKDAGSLYVQCDGFPNNMTTGEGVARFLGAVTLLGLFAPPPEAADASKRKFGTDGVMACTNILEGEKAEGNVRRRIPLILARALHRIEAKDYDGAIADVAIARAEAGTAGLTTDPYFNRSMGLSFDQVEAAALVRKGEVEEAMRVSLGDVPQHRFSLMPLFSFKTYADIAPLGTDADLGRALALARVSPGASTAAAGRLDELSRFGESATLRADLVTYLSTRKDKDGKLRDPATKSVAELALGQALAGQWAEAAASAERARALDAKLVGEGKPEDMDIRLPASEILDLYDVLLLANQGNIEGARRKFTARTQWLAPSFGAVLATNRLLYDGAPAADRTGQLAKPAADLWTDRATAKRAELIAKDGDNKTLFYLIEPYVAGSTFEAQSQKVWRTDKSKIFLKLTPGKGDPDAKLAMLYGVPADAAFDAMLLHAALDAKAQGKQGFTFLPIIDTYVAGIVHAGNTDDPSMPPSLFLNADEVIAALSPAIPDPVTLKARRATRGK
ncbi:hypothetical protein [Sphingopyxis sp. KK2]|uniref:hypothetical protein n=1 Tax=Sphingopyxis sp. KK2 TaxID=1855727 RepID=UPI00097E6CBA|nr:hypothetical protein [Sphingopyxis sp. KK2]